MLANLIFNLIKFKMIFQARPEAVMPSDYFEITYLYLDYIFILIFQISSPSD